MKEYPQTVGNMTAMGEIYFQFIKGRNLLVYPDDEIRLAVSRAVAVEGPRQLEVCEGRTDAHKIDIVIAMGMAALACVKGQAKPGFDATYSGFQD